MVSAVTFITDLAQNILPRSKSRSTKSSYRGKQSFVLLVITLTFIMLAPVITTLMELAVVPNMNNHQLLQQI